ncbi:MAG: cytochrome c nitrite reductase small subunit [Myxococcota bacterium]
MGHGRCVHRDGDCLPGGDPAAESVLWIARLTPRRVWLWLGAALGVALGLGLFTLAYAKGLSYVSDAPEACVNCHIMREQYDGWLKGSHHAIATCNGCHVPQDFFGKWTSKALNGFHHSMAFTLQNFREPIQITPRNAAALEANCLRCHGDFVREIAIPHPGQPADCTHCHAGVGHGSTG